MYYLGYSVLEVIREELLLIFLIINSCLRVWKLVNLCLLIMETKVSSDMFRLDIEHVYSYCVCLLMHIRKQVMFCHQCD